MKKVTAFILGLSLVCSLSGCKSTDYSRGKKFFENGEYENAIKLFEKLGDYEDAEFWVENSKRMIEREIVYANESEVKALFDEKKITEGSDKVRELLDVTIEYGGGDHYSDHYPSYAEMFVEMAKTYNDTNFHARNAILEEIIEWAEKNGNTRYSVKDFSSLKARATDFGTIVRMGNFLQKLHFDREKLITSVITEAANPRYEKQPIQWIVIGRNGSSLLVLSKYCLTREMDNNFTLADFDKEVPFDVFSSSEKDRIMTPEYAFPSNNIPKGIIFELSKEEYEKYAKGVEGVSGARATDYAWYSGSTWGTVAQYDDMQTTTVEWNLRDDVSGVSYKVNKDGTVSQGQASYCRPAMWITLE